MSIAHLLEKYDVSTEEGLQKALAEIEKEEEEVDEALTHALSKACTLEGRLRVASQGYTKLEAVKKDAQVAADMVEKTAALARDVSAKVRQLDLARSRVAECQQRVHDLIDLRVCSAGVEAAIKAHDYEVGAAHVARFLSMAPGSVAAARARGVSDPRQDMAKATQTLRDHLVKKFEEAAKKDDETEVVRLFQLFPQIGYAEEGVGLLAKYLATKADVSIRSASVVTGEAVGAAVYADALTRVLEAGAAAVERARELASCAPGQLPRALAIIQPSICRGVSRVCSQLVAARRSAGAGAGGGAGARAAEPALGELAVAHARLQMYFAFLRRRIQMDAETLEEDAKEKCVVATEKIIAECESTRIAQDVLSHYLELERYFLEESVNKALKMSTQAGAAASSLVDDVFFIARKVIRRGISTGSADGACAALNECGAQLERAAAALRRALSAPPHAPLTFPPPPHLRDAAPSAADALAANAAYLAHINEAESGAEWAERLAAEACAAAEAAALCRGTSERDKVRSCAAQLAAAAAAFRAAHELALQAVRAALQPRAAHWADVLTDPDTDMEEVDEEANALVAALDALAEQARTQLPRAADSLLSAVLADLTARAHRNILRHQYTREGGLSVERRARRLAAWCGSSAGGARERCARLTQAAALLTLERPAHARDALLPAARLAPHEAREILARSRYGSSLAQRQLSAANFSDGIPARHKPASCAHGIMCRSLMAHADPRKLQHNKITDFKLEEIKRLKL